MTEKDPEVDAIQTVTRALEGLDEETRIRVIEWAANRYKVQITSGGSSQRGPSRGAGERAEPTTYERFVDLLDDTSPTSEPERALVGGYWYQELGGNESFTGQQVNSLLKDTGNGVSNITRAIDTLQARRPALVRQVSKSGKSRQARKTYRLTTAGIQVIGHMISGEGQDENES